MPIVFPSQACRGSHIIAYHIISYHIVSLCLQVEKLLARDVTQHQEEGKDGDASRSDGNQGKGTQIGLHLVQQVHAKETRDAADDGEAGGEQSDDLQRRSGVLVAADGTLPTWCPASI